MSANTLTGLIPTLYRNLDVVSQEPVGYAPSVSRDAQASRAAKGQLITVNRTPPIASVDIVPAMSVPEGDGVEMDPVTMTITRSKKVPLPWRGEEILSLASPGPTHNSVLDNEIQQAFRTLRNEIDVDLAIEIKNTASRAIGAAGTTPFNNKIDESADALKVMVDNGAPLADLQMVINSTAGAQLRKNTQLTKVNEAGTDQTLRNGVLLDLNGFRIRESAGVQTTTKGTGSSYTSDASGYAVGATDITLITGSGTIVAGDVATFAGDLNKYIVTTGISTPGTITIADPGLRIALPTSAVALTVGDTAVQNSFFAKSGVILLNRLPELPPSGDMATDRTLIFDSINNLFFDVALYLGYHMAQWEISTAWGVKNIKPEHTGTLLG
jgi:hypothetical protein